MSKIIFYLLLLWMGNVAAQNQPEIVDITPAQTKDNRASVEFSCKVKGTSGYNVLWKKTDGNPDSAAELISTNTAVNIQDARYSVKFDQRTSAYNLDIFDLRPSDVGTYICEIPLDKDHVVTAQTRLELLVRPYFYQNDTAAVNEVDENSDFTIECYAGGSPKPTVTISRNDGFNLRDNLNYVEGNTLKIEKIQIKDAGKYRCTAAIKGAITSKDIFIEVRTAPVIHSCRLNVIYRPDFNAAIECLIESHVVPEVSWYKDGQQLSNGAIFVSNVISGSEKLHNATLKIVTNTTEYGQYSVKARNKLGEQETTVGVTPNFPTSCPEASYVAYISIIVILLILLIVIVVVGVLYVRKIKPVRS